LLVALGKGLVAPWGPCGLQLSRLTTGPGKSWKVLEFKKTISPGLGIHGKQQRSWKVMENKHNVIDVMEFLQLH